MALTASTAAGAQVTAESCTFTSDDPDMLDDHRRARERFAGADREYKAIIKRMDATSPGDRTPALQREYNRLQLESTSARRDLLLLESRLEMIPAKPIAARGAAQLRDAETRRVGQIIHAMTEAGTPPAEMVARLQAMLPAFSGHPAEGAILVTLGKLSEGSYPMAVSYYTAATRCAVPSDRWGFAEQEAWKRLSALHEREGELGRAIDALKNWDISEPCGTGAAASHRRKTARLLSLRLRYHFPSIILVLGVLVASATLLLRRKLRPKPDKPRAPD
jgi:hypothetical protein